MSLVGEAKAQSVACTTAHPCQDVLAKGLTTAYRSSIFVDAGVVYVTTPNALMRVPTNGRATASPILTTAAAPHAGSFVFNQGNLCWTDLHAIRCQPVVGGPITTVQTFPPSHDVAFLVTAGSTFYWIRNTEWVESMPTTGGPVTTIAHVAPGGHHGPYDEMLAWLATDGTYLYWASRVLVQSRLLSGGSITTLVKPNPAMLFHDFKAVGGELFAADSGGMFAVHAGGGSQRSLVNPYTFVDQIALDGTTVYWIESLGRSLNSMPSGGGPITHYTFSGTPMALTVDATSLYYLTRQGDLVKVTPK